MTEQEADRDHYREHERRRRPVSTGVLARAVGGGPSVAVAAVGPVAGRAAGRPSRVGPASAWAGLVAPGPGSRRSPASPRPAPQVRPAGAPSLPATARAPSRTGPRRGPWHRAPRAGRRRWRVWRRVPTPELPRCRSGPAARQIEPSRVPRGRHGLGLQRSRLGGRRIVRGPRLARLDLGLGRPDAGLLRRLDRPRGVNAARIRRVKDSVDRLQQLARSTRIARRAPWPCRWLSPRRACAGSSGRWSVTFGGGSAMWAYRTAASESFGNGTTPVRHS